MHVPFFLQAQPLITRHPWLISAWISRRLLVVVVVLKIIQLPLQQFFQHCLLNALFKSGTHWRGSSLLLYCLFATNWACICRGTPFICYIKRTQISPAVKEQSLSLSAQVYLKRIVKMIEVTATVKIMSLIDRSGSGLTC